MVVWPERVCILFWVPGEVRRETKDEESTRAMEGGWEGEGENVPVKWSRVSPSKRPSSPPSSSKMALLYTYSG
jgi:hypothetical protein